MGDVTPMPDDEFYAALAAARDNERKREINAAVAAARAEIVGWIEAEAAQVQAFAEKCQFQSTRAQSFTEARVLRETAAAIESGAPQRWAAEREQGRG